MSLSLLDIVNNPGFIFSQVPTTVRESLTQVVDTIVCESFCETIKVRIKKASNDLATRIKRSKHNKDRFLHGHADWLARRIVVTEEEIHLVCIYTFSIYIKYVYYDVVNTHNKIV
jgi:hypothetical protein